MPLKNHIALSDLLGEIKDTLENKFGRYTYRILAEITDIKVYHNRQYAFLTLIEKQNGEVIASAGAVIWRDHFATIRNFEKATGVNFNQNLELILEVEVQYNIRYGLRISILNIDESYTLGKLEQERQNTLAQLMKDHPKWVWMREGEYRSANHLKKLPMVVQKVALISAAGSDGRRDFLHELENNEYGIDYSIMEFPAQVQGDAAASQIAAQINKINGTTGAFDTVAIVRGGGSSTDFSAFDSYQVGLAVAYCPYPVFTGIGHERNICIADLLAYGPEKTPTKCAASLTEHNIAFLALVQNATENIQKRGLNMLEMMKQQTQSRQENLLKSAQWRLVQEKQFLHRVSDKASMSAPQNTLQRGFTLVRKNGKHIGKSEMLANGDTVEIEFMDGKRSATMN